ncbi:DUF2975 domain-containing protein [Microvirga tunisiensis]|uniref:DUF2975 domain-containing protein n=2 Tax=Pannonibacter tanglangensis TaxID=2750084 RepID=A0A7X5J8H6_9HYPH|nr:MULTISPECIES: DUF2975 domain-containing protein [unclassified Pannonibacter]NBN62956.1 DUF2975 domain-containing protein [Pannonibacter sp. XCT-34]NBN78527.1 DUF2975 domain-containing protein [Pannonibacter sp. XCT-53]
MTQDVLPPLPQPADDRAARLAKIRRLSLGLKWTLTVLFALMVLFSAFTLWIVLDPAWFQLPPEEMTVEFGEVERSVMEIPLPQRIGVAFVAVWFFGLILWLMWKLRQLFERYACLDFYSSRSLSMVVHTGWLLLAIGLSDILTDMLGGVLVTLDRPAGERILAFSLDGSQIFFLVFGPMSLLLGWVLREAALAYEENQQFV